MKLNISILSQAAALAVCFPLAFSLCAQDAAPTGSGEVPAINLPDAPGAPDAPKAPEDPTSLGESDIEALMQAQSSKEAGDLIASFTKRGVKAPLLNQVQLIRAFQLNDHEELAKLMPTGDLTLAPFDGPTLFFESADSYHSFLLLARGSTSLVNERVAEAKSDFMDALWLAPEHAGIVGDQISAYKGKAALANYVMPLDTPLKDSQGKDTTLATLMKGKKALLIDFWASWCGPCMTLMPELVQKSEKLTPQNVLVVGMNTENDAAAAEKVRTEKNIGNIPWLMEPAETPFSKGLDINSIPRMVLVTPDGKVLYNGHPAQPGLADALKKVEAEL